MCKMMKEKEISIIQMEETVHNLRIENSKFINLFKNIKASNTKDQKHLICMVYFNIKF